MGGLAVGNGAEEKRGEQGIAAVAADVEFALMQPGGNLLGHGVGDLGGLLADAFFQGGGGFEIGDRADGAHAQNKDGGGGDQKPIAQTQLHGILLRKIFC